MNTAADLALADTEPPPPPARWHVLTSRGARGRSWEELSPAERSEVIADYGDLGVSRLMFWERIRCYACDAAAFGYRDRRPEGGRLEHACQRHAERS